VPTYVSISPSTGVTLLGEDAVALIIKKYGWGDWLDYKILSDLNDQLIFPLIKGENIDYAG